MCSRERVRRLYHQYIELLLFGTNPYISDITQSAFIFTECINSTNDKMLKYLLLDVCIFHYMFLSFHLNHHLFFCLWLLFSPLTGLLQIMAQNSRHIGHFRDSCFCCFCLWVWRNDYQKHFEHFVRDHLCAYTDGSI